MKQVRSFYILPAAECRYLDKRPTFGESLKSGEGLSTVSLLNTDVDVVLGLLLLGSLSGGVWLRLVAEIGEGIVTGEVLNIHKLLTIDGESGAGPDEERSSGVRRGTGGVSKENERYQRLPRNVKGKARRRKKWW